MRLKRTPESYQQVVSRISKTSVNEVANFYRVSNSHLRNFLNYGKTSYPEIWEIYKESLDFTKKKVRGKNIPVSDVSSIMKRVSMGESLQKIATDYNVVTNSLYKFIRKNKSPLISSTIPTVPKIEWKTPVLVNKSENGILSLIKNNKLSVEDIIVCYTECVRKEYETYWMHYDIMKEFKSNSELYNKKILPCIKLWWTRNIEQLVNKKLLRKEK